MWEFLTDSTNVLFCKSNWRGFPWSVKDSIYWRAWWTFFVTNPNPCCVEIHDFCSIKQYLCWVLEGILRVAISLFSLLLFKLHLYISCMMTIFNFLYLCFIVLCVGQLYIQCILILTWPWCCNTVASVWITERNILQLFIFPPREMWFQKWPLLNIFEAYKIIQMCSSLHSRLKKTPILCLTGENTV